MNPLGYLKAIAGGVLAGLGMLYMALDNDVVTMQEWVGVAQGSLAAFATVWGIPNIKGGATEGIPDPTAAKHAKLVNGL